MPATLRRSAGQDLVVNTYVVLLRAINLGSHNKVSMADLRALVAAAGAEDVKTYVQSGNVVCRSAAETGSQLARAIAERIHQELDLAVTVLVLDQDELAKVVAANPFLDAGRDAAKAHVTVLVDEPDPACVRDLEAMSFGPDEFRVEGRAVYLYCPDGYGRSKLSNAFLEKRLGVAATTRNWRTVTTLAEMCATA